MTIETINHIANIEEKEHVGKVLDHVNGYDVIECEKCEFAHIVPLISHEFAAERYKKDFYKDPNYIKSHEAEKEWKYLAYDEQLSFLESHLHIDSRRLLDIGSGPGYFLLRAKERGWDGVGLEPSSQAVAHSKEQGLNVHQELLTENALRLGKFNAIYMGLMFEHVLEPFKFLRIVHELLADDGNICITLSNDYNPFQKVLRKVLGYKPWWVVPTDHVNYFNHQSIQKLLMRCGFSISYITSTFPIDMFLLMGDNYVGNDKLGKQCHIKRKNFELALHDAGLDDLRTKLYEKLAECNIGREIVVYAKKK